MSEAVILSLFCNGWHTRGCSYRHTDRIIEDIFPAERNGQMAPVTWYIAVDKRRSVIAEFNGAHVEEVHYEAPE